MSRPNVLSASAPIAGVDLAPILEPGEQILWSGRPVFSRYMRSGPWYLIPFSISGAASRSSGRRQSSLPAPAVFLRALGIPFVLVGLYMVGRYFVLARQARAALYAVTDRRVLIVGGTFRSKVTEMRLGSLPPVMVNQDLSGVGAITFGMPTQNTAIRRSGLPVGTAAEDVPSFIAIERPSEVARIIE